jgi:hypothetical protein
MGGLELLDVQVVLELAVAIHFHRGTNQEIVLVGTDIRPHETECPAGNVVFEWNQAACASMSVSPGRV